MYLISFKYFKVTDVDFSQLLFYEITDTTRARRSQENDGVEYIFISKHLFETDVQNNKYVKFC